MLKCEDEVFLIKPVPVQNNSSDCGLFALAFAFDLTNNLDPSIITYNEKILRKHSLPSQHFNLGSTLWINVEITLIQR